VENITTHFKALSEVSSLELILVNDGSTKNFNDGFVQKLSSLLPNIKIIEHTTNCGKGYALRQGVKQAKGAFIIYTDIDFPYTHESFLKIYNSLRNEDVDMAIGTRSEEYYRHLPRARVRISKLLKWFIKTFFASQ
jgi:glycosyltransferase involved in cell wall biosynthesis